MQPPDYYNAIRQDAKARWEQLECDPENANTWRQLFSQLQSPRHVLSELLQNADDAGATWASAQIRDGVFLFEHNGHDFEKEEFRSLCRFAFSNKRNLHTIGFRGVGFKSTFSLGDELSVLTPSLSVRFNQRRFTEPCWIDNGTPTDGTTIVSVVIKDENCRNELEKNLNEWRTNPLSLLFFQQITRLQISEELIEKQELGPGPVPSSFRIRLSTAGDTELCLFHSEPEAFPEELAEEIRKERFTNDLDLPPCRVELVLGLEKGQHLFVVLPTDVDMALPFSCNAPFLQDPDRKAIKAPGVSPTNRWLLERVGRLAGHAMLAWLGSDDYPLGLRAEAYRLLLPIVESGDSLEADCTEAITRSFEREIDEKPLLLTTTGMLVETDNCIDVPTQLHSVWDPDVLRHIFAGDREHLLAVEVHGALRQRLQRRHLLKSLGKEEVARRLGEDEVVPRPSTLERLPTLWAYVEENVEYYGYGPDKRRSLQILPVHGNNDLVSANRSVRLSARYDKLHEEDWQFLTSHVTLVDSEWVRYLKQLGEAESPTIAVKRTLKLQEALGLSTATPIGTVIDLACSSALNGPDVDLDLRVHLAHMVARLDIHRPKSLNYATRDENIPRLGSVVFLRYPAVADLLPSVWADTHLLHPRYEVGSRSCSVREWQDWAHSEKSGLLPFAAIEKQCSSVSGKSEIKKFIKSRGGNLPTRYPYQSTDFKINDSDFHHELVAHWLELARTDEGVWAKVLREILLAREWFWRDHLKATIDQKGYTLLRPVDTGDLVAGWIARFRKLRCLPDTYGTLHEPAGLFLLTPATRPLDGAEPFVDSELDTEATRPLLLLLGVRNNPTSLTSLVEKLRGLARTADPLPVLEEITKWYGALDRVLPRCDESETRNAIEVFKNEKLILTDRGRWVRSIEVFQNPDDHALPDAEVIHAGARNLRMWPRLGVAERPTAELILTWLKQLPSGKKPDADTMRRIEGVLKRYPSEVWRKCGYWLSLDGDWRAVGEFKQRLTKGSMNKWSMLFTNIKAHVADLRMLSADHCDTPPFSDLADLGSLLEYRPSGEQADLPDPVAKPWLLALGEVLQRIKLADEESTLRVRATAQRLAQTAWQPFRALKVTPYLAGTPAGEPHEPDALWHGQTLYVREGSLIRRIDQVVQELSRSFGHTSIIEAVKMCWERDPRIIYEYIDNRFDLEDANVTTGRADAELPTVSEDQPDADGVRIPTDEGDRDLVQDIGIVPEGEPDDPPGPEFGHTTQRSTRPREPRQDPPLIARYAHARGYQWSEEIRHFINNEHCRIQVSESPFSWERRSADGGLVRRYWVSEQSLGHAGIELSTELWEIIRQNPHTTGLIVLGEGHQPRELTGTNLMQMQEDNRIQIYPAKYRIRLTE